MTRSIHPKRVHAEWLGFPPVRDPETAEYAAWALVDRANVAAECRSVGARLERGDELLSPGLVESRTRHYSGDPHPTTHTRT
jgi:hypothetical protein